MIVGRSSIWTLWTLAQSHLVKRTNLSKQMFSLRAPTQPAKPRVKVTPPTTRTNQTGSKPCIRVTWVRSSRTPLKYIRAEISFSAAVFAQNRAWNRQNRHFLHNVLTFLNSKHLLNIFPHFHKQSHFFFMTWPPCPATHFYPPTCLIKWTVWYLLEND